LLIEANRGGIAELGLVRVEGNLEALLQMKVADTQVRLLV